jgi:hypothetical protein
MGRRQDGVTPGVRTTIGVAEVSGHLRSCLANRGDAVALLPVIGVNPHPHVHFTADEFTEDHADFLRAGGGDKPHCIFGVDP